MRLTILASLLLCFPLAALADSPMHIRLTSSSSDVTAEERAEQRHIELLSAIATLADAIRNQRSDCPPPVEIVQRASVPCETSSGLLTVMGSRMEIPSVYRQLPSLRRTREVPSIVLLDGVPTIVSEERPNLLLRLCRALR